MHSFIAATALCFCVKSQKPLSIFSPALADASLFSIDQPNELIDNNANGYLLSIYPIFII